MTWKDFEAQMDRMVGLKFRPAEMRTHWEGLHELPDAVLEAAVTRAIRTRVEFPTPAELREDADAVAHLLPREPDEDRGEALAEPVVLGMLPDGTPLPMARRMWRFYDERCRDSGWASWWCGSADDVRRHPDIPVQACGRVMAHAAHEWIAPCACRDSNPAVVRKRERDRKYAEASKSRGGA